VLDLVTFGNPLLRKKAKRVEEIDASIRAIAEDMLACMHLEQGVGLAAEQVGLDVAMCVIELPADEACGIPMPLILINPEIVASEGQQLGQEGCLSFPGIYVNIPRFESVRVTFLSLEGKEETVEATGLCSRALQHEVDHLDGVLLVDRMNAVQKVAQGTRLKRIKRDTKKEL